MRAPLGRRGSYLPTALTSPQCVGWAIFELLDHRHRGGRALRRAVRLLSAVALDDCLRRCRARARTARPDRLRPALRAQARHLGGAGRARLPDLVGARRLPTSAISGRRPARAASPSGRAPTSSSAITVSWIPLAADYTRFSRGRRAGFGDRARLPDPDALAFSLGAVLFFSRDLTDAAALPAAVAAAGVVAALALFALTVTRWTRRSRTCTRRPSRRRTSSPACRSGPSSRSRRRPAQSARSRFTWPRTRPF